MDALKGKENGELTVDFYTQIGRDGHTKEYVEEAFDNGTGALQEIALIIKRSTKAGGNQEDFSGFFGTGKYALMKGVKRLEIITNNGNRAFQLTFEVVNDENGKPISVRLTGIRKITDPRILNGPTTVRIRRIKYADETIPGLDMMLTRRAWVINTGLSQSAKYKIYFVEHDGVTKKQLSVPHQVLSESQVSFTLPPPDGRVVTGSVKIIETKDLPSQANATGMRVQDIPESYLALIPASVRSLFKSRHIVIEFPLPLIHTRDEFLDEKTDMLLTQIQKVVAIEFYKSLAFKVMTQKKPQFVFSGYPIEYETRSENDYDDEVMREDSLWDMAQAINTGRYDLVTPDMLAQVQTVAGITDLQKKLAKLVILLKVPIDATDPGFKTSIFERRLAVLREVKKQKQAEEMARKLAERGHTVDTTEKHQKKIKKSDPHFGNRVTEFQARARAIADMKRPWDYADGTGTQKGQPRTELEKELFELCVEMGKPIGIEQVVLVGANFHAAGAFQMWNGKRTFFVNRGIMNWTGKPAMDTYISQVFDTVNHEYGHYLEDGVISEKAWEDGFAVDVTHLSHDSIGLFAEGRKYLSLRWMLKHKPVISESMVGPMKETALAYMPLACSNCSIFDHQRETLYQSFVTALEEKDYASSREILKRYMNLVSTHYGNAFINWITRTQKNEVEFSVARAQLDEMTAYLVATEHQPSLGLWTKAQKSYDGAQLNIYHAVQTPEGSLVLPNLLALNRAIQAKDVGMQRIISTITSKEQKRESQQSIGSRFLMWVQARASDAASKKGKSVNVWEALLQTGSGIWGMFSFFYVSNNVGEQYFQKLTLPEFNTFVQTMTSRFGALGPHINWTFFIWQLSDFAFAGFIMASVCYGIEYLYGLFTKFQKEMPKKFYILAAIISIYGYQLYDTSRMYWGPFVHYLTYPLEFFEFAKILILDDPYDAFAMLGGIIVIPIARILFQYFKSRGWSIAKGMKALLVSGGTLVVGLLLIGRTLLDTRRPIVSVQPRYQTSGTSNSTQASSNFPSVPLEVDQKGPETAQRETAVANASIQSGPDTVQSKSIDQGTIKLQSNVDGGNNGGGKGQNTQINNDSIFDATYPVPPTSFNPQSLPDRFPITEGLALESMLVSNQSIQSLPGFIKKYISFSTPVQSVLMGLVPTATINSPEFFGTGGNILQQIVIYTLERTGFFRFVSQNGHLVMINMVSARRMVTMYPDYFPEEAQKDPDRWLVTHRADWASSTDISMSMNDVRQGLLSGIREEAAKKYTNPLLDPQKMAVSFLGQGNAGYTIEDTTWATQMDQMYRYMLERFASRNRSLEPPTQSWVALPFIRIRDSLINWWRWQTMFRMIPSTREVWWQRWTIQRLKNDTVQLWQRILHILTDIQASNQLNRSVDRYTNRFGKTAVDEILREAAQYYDVPTGDEVYIKNRAGYMNIFNTLAPIPFDGENIPLYEKGSYGRTAFLAKALAIRMYLQEPVLQTERTGIQRETVNQIMEQARPLIRQSLAHNLNIIFPNDTAESVANKGDMLYKRVFPDGGKFPIFILTPNDYVLLKSSHAIGFAIRDGFMMSVDSSTIQHKDAVAVAVHEADHFFQNIYGFELAGTDERLSRLLVEGFARMFELETMKSDATYIKRRRDYDTYFYVTKTLEQQIYPRLVTNIGEEAAKRVWARAKIGDLQGLVEGFGGISQLYDTLSLPDIFGSELKAADVMVQRAQKSQSLAERTTIWGDESLVLPNGQVIPLVSIKTLQGITFDPSTFKLDLVSMLSKGHTFEVSATRLPLAAQVYDLPKNLKTVRINFYTLNEESREEESQQKTNAFLQKQLIDSLSQADCFAIQTGVERVYAIENTARGTVCPVWGRSLWRSMKNDVSRKEAIQFVRELFRNLMHQSDGSNTPSNPDPQNDNHSDENAINQGPLSNVPTFMSLLSWYRTRYILFDGWGLSFGYRFESFLNALANKYTMNAFLRSVYQRLRKNDRYELYQYAKTNEEVFETDGKEIPFFIDARHAKPVVELKNNIVIRLVYQDRSIVRIHPEEEDDLDKYWESVPAEHEISDFLNGLDGSFGLALRAPIDGYEQTIAIMGFEYLVDSNGKPYLLVRLTPQGMSPDNPLYSTKVKRALYSVNFRDALMDAVVQTARRYGISRVTIIGVEHNLKFNPLATTADLQRIYSIVDGVAQSHGYTRNIDGNYDVSIDPAGINGGSGNVVGKKMMAPVISVFEHLRGTVWSAQRTYTRNIRSLTSFLRAALLRTQLVVFHLASTKESSSSIPIDLLSQYQPRLVDSKRIQEYKSIRNQLGLSSVGHYGGDEVIRFLQSLPEDAELYRGGDADIRSDWTLDISYALRVTKVDPFGHTRNHPTLYVMRVGDLLTAIQENSGYGIFGGAPGWENIYFQNTTRVEQILQSIPMRRYAYDWIAEAYMNQVDGKHEEELSAPKRSGWEQFVKTVQPFGQFSIFQTTSGN
jgi:hypothetical protein